MRAGGVSQPRCEPAALDVARSRTERHSACNDRRDREPCAPREASDLQGRRLAARRFGDRQAPEIYTDRAPKLPKASPCWRGEPRRALP